MIKKELETIHMNYVWASCAASRLRVDERQEGDLRTIRNSLRTIEKILRRIMTADRDIQTR